MIVREIEVEGALVLSDTQVHRALGAIELGARLQLIERPIDERRARSCAGCSVVRTSQKSPEASAADRPGLAVTVNGYVRISGAVRGVKELSAGKQSEVHRRIPE